MVIVAFWHMQTSPGLMSAAPDTGLQAVTVHELVKVTCRQPHGDNNNNNRNNNNNSKYNSRITIIVSMIVSRYASQLIGTYSACPNLALNIFLHFGHTVDTKLHPSGMVQAQQSTPSQ